MKEPKVEYKQLNTSKEQKDPARKKRCTCTLKLCLFSILIMFLLFASSIFLFVGIGGVCCFPLHASCAVDWSFNAKCDLIKTSLVKQIHAWEGPDNCKNGGEKCLYKLVSEGDMELKVNHETPKKHYVDNMTFTFQQSGATCKVKGSSSSETWYALLDNGTNYCNLHNLITGAGLDKKAGYSEVTNNKQCTQYSSADCEVY